MSTTHHSKIRHTILAALLSLLAIVNPTAISHAQISTNAKEAKKRADALRKADSALSDKQRQLLNNIQQAASAHIAGNINALRDTSTTAADNQTGARLRISLLTCGPGNEVYEYYGHTAIRVVRTDSAALDITFNYGVFDFSSGNFALRFALGKTDYRCVSEPTEYFLQSYRNSGRYVDEQILNLTQPEANRLFNALQENVKPENCVYRYNFFFDNCATRARNIIERSLVMQLQYPIRPTERSLRDAVHFYCRQHPWPAFGQDLLLGSDADVPATGRDLQFVPLILAQDLDQTFVVGNNGMVYKLVTKTQRLVEADPAKTAVTNNAPSPLAVATILVAAALILGIWEIRKRRIVWAVDSAALALLGLAGVIVTFVFLFSTHPTVNSNMLVWIFNPLPLVGLYWQIKGGRKRNYKSYHIVAAPITLAFFIAACHTSQKIDTAVLLLALFLLIRNITNLIVWAKNRKATRLQQQATTPHAKQI